MDNSESLLTEILLLVQTLNTNVEDFRIKLNKVESDILQLKRSVDKILKDGFVDADLKAHKEWHLEERRGWFRKLFN